MWKEREWDNSASLRAYILIFHFIILLLCLSESRALWNTQSDLFHWNRSQYAHAAAAVAAAEAETNGRNGCWRKLTLIGAPPKWVNEWEIVAKSLMRAARGSRRFSSLFSIEKSVCAGGARTMRLQQRQQHRRASVLFAPCSDRRATRDSQSATFSM